MTAKRASCLILILLLLAGAAVGAEEPRNIRTGREIPTENCADPKVITFIVDGKLCDGGSSRQLGWGRFTVDLGRVTADKTPRIAPDFAACVRGLRVCDRYLRTSEAVGNYRAGVEGR